MTSVKVSYPTRTREEVIASLREQVRALAEQLPLEQAVLFGSWASGEQTVASDVDLLVVDGSDGQRDVYQVLKRSLEVRGLEPHVVSIPAYRRRRDHFERMTEDGVLIYDRGQEVSDRVRAALEGHSAVRFAYLFGSRGRGPRPHHQSDVDVAVYLDTEAGVGSCEGVGLWPKLHGDLVQALSPILGRGDRGQAPEGVDLVLLNEAPPLLADRVLRTGTPVLSRSESERLAWVVRTKSRYCDLRPLRARLDAAVTDRLQAGRFGRPGTSAAGRTTSEPSPQGDSEAARG